MSAGRRRRTAKHILFALAVCLSVPSAWAKNNWVEAWYSPPFPTTAIWGCNQLRSYSHQTVRQVIQLQAGGKILRVRLTNEIGLTPLRIGQVTIARSSPNGVVQPRTLHVLHFSGSEAAVIPVGKALVSDPVNMKVRRFEDIAISIYYPSFSQPAGHLKTLMISPSGNHARDAVWAMAQRVQAPEAASAVEVQSQTVRPVLVAFGDSITEGFCSTPGMHLDYPDQLAHLLAKKTNTRSWIIINSGISGNRLLHDGWGTKAIARYRRDALDIPGVRAIVLLEGINDIGQG